jgi:hypothetical protein
VYVHLYGSEKKTIRVLGQRNYKVVHVKLEDDIVVTERSELLKNEQDEGFTNSYVFTMDDDLVEWREGERKFKSS